MCRWFDPRRIIQGADTLRRLPQSNQIGALRFKASIAKKPQRGGSAGSNLALCRWASTRLNNSQARTSFQENPAEAHLASGPRKKRPQPRGDQARTVPSRYVLGRPNTRKTNEPGRNCSANRWALERCNPWKQKGATAFFFQLLQFGRGEGWTVKFINWQVRC